MRQKRSQDADYGRQKATLGANQKAKRDAARDIGQAISNAVPADRTRRRNALRSFRYFLTAYFSETFYSPFSDDHELVIARIQEAIVTGNSQAIACMRGFGKTVLIELGAVWAVLTGRRHFVVVVGASADHAQDLLDSIASRFENETLAADFPEVCLPITRLNGIKQTRLLYYGKPITYRHTKRRIILPVIPGSRASGAIIHCVGIEGSIRGIKYTDKATGLVHRPDLLLLDDIQTDESAASPTQIATRLNKIRSSLQGLKGIRKSLAALAALTVICAGDVADQLLDHKLNPSWRGLRYGQISRIPTELAADASPEHRKQAELWQRYWELRIDDLANERLTLETSEATAFYRANQTAMDADIVIQWEHRFEPQKQISAIQHIMDEVQERGVGAVLAEYNNQPKVDSQADVRLEAADLMRRLNHLKRGVCPASTTRITAMIDVHGDLLYWLVLATDDAYRCDVIDYGTYPEQARRIFQKDECRHTFRKTHADQPTLEAQLTAALHVVIAGIASKTFVREDGVELALQRGLVDCKWGEQSATVFNAIATSGFKSQWMASEGEGITARKRQMSSWPPRRGERKGREWVIAANRGQMRLRFDTNYWKSFTASRLTVAVGAPGSLQLYGSNPEEHRNLSGHWTAEEAFRREELRVVNEWKQKVPKRDNHWWDCVVGSIVAASTLGADIREAAKPTPSPSAKSSASPSVKLATQNDVRFETTESGRRKIIPRRISRGRDDD